MKKRLLIAFLVLASFCGVIFGGAPVSAATKNTTELQKALLTDLRYCYINNKMKADLGVLSNYTSYSSIIQNNGGESYVRLPNDYTDINDDDLSCDQLLNGYDGAGGSFEGLFAMAGVTPPVNSSNVATKESFLTGMGYEKTEGSAGQCVAFYYKVETSTSAPFYGSESEQYQYTYQLCSPIVNADGTIGVDKMEVVKEGGTEIVEFEINTNNVKLDCVLYSPIDGGCEKHEFTKDVTSWNEFVTGLLSDLAAHLSNRPTVIPTSEYSSYSYTYILQSDVKRTNYGTVNATYKLKSPTEDAANVAIKYLSKNVYDAGSDLYYSPAQQVVLYQTYLEDYYAADIRCDQTGDALTIVEGQGYKQVRIWRNGAFNDNCWALAKSNANSKVNGLTDTRWFTQERSFDEIVAALFDSTVITLTADQAANLGDTATDEPPGIDNPNTVTPDEPPEEEASCFDGGGALGWILCPLLDFLGNATTRIYESIIEPFLEVDAQLFSESGSGEGTFQAWQMFQAIANIVFIILLLVVIFSQFTGVGIDNYGIKKILPKLIITAMLINLSYIICQLAVDLSNILGFGAKNMLDSMANGVAVNTVMGETVEISGGATAFTAIVGIVAIGVGAAALLSAGAGIILPVLLALMAAFIGIIFTFVLLGVRQAGVVLLVVMSPLAFVAYTLPNTKKLFDKWRKMFQGLLLFFPICGLLMGAGNLTSKILLSTNSDNFYVALIAMLLNVVPLFFLPTLLKASFAAMGNIGAKISGMGKSANKWAQGKARPAMENSAWGQKALARKNYNQYRKAERGKALQSEYQAKRAGAVVGRFGGRNLSDLSVTQRASLAGARQTVAAQDAQQTKMFADYFASMGTGKEIAGGLDEALASGNEQMMAAAIDKLASNGDFDLITNSLKGVDPSRLSRSMRDRLSNSLITHKKDAAHLWGWSKQMKGGSNMSLADYASGTVERKDANGATMRDGSGNIMYTSAMRQDLEKENDDLMTTQDKTSLEAISGLTGKDGSLAFSDKQMINASGGLDKGSSQKEFGEMLAGSGRADEIVGQMNASQLAKIKGSTLEAVARSAHYTAPLNVQTGKADYSGFDLASKISPDVLTQLRDPQNASLVAGMSPDVRKSLGL